MKKYAGMTWWKNNYGSILQAYALSKVINDIDNLEYEVVQQFSVNAVTLKNLLESVKERGLLNTIRYACGKFGMKSLRRRNERCEKFVCANIKISHFFCQDNNIDELNNLYDGFLCGSDQIWNPSITEIGGKYWLNFAKKTKIAYAPSLGVTELKEEEVKRIKLALRDFKAISCRENKGTELINIVLEEEKCSTVVDPTLLLCKEEWDGIASRRLVEGEYVFSYILRGDINQKKMVKEFAKKNNLTLITIPFLEADYYSFYDFRFGEKQYTDANPSDFISLIKYASFVFTDSFHCMIFSSIYHKCFFMLKKYGVNQMLRINDFLQWMELGNRVVENMDDVYNLLSENEAEMWDRYEKRLNTERINSKKFLIEALEQ